MIEAFSPSLLAPPGDGLLPAWQWLSATWFGAGLVAPLRAGLAVCITIPLALWLMNNTRHGLALLVIVVFALGVYASSAIELATGVKDDRRIVIDEVGAFLIGAWMLRGRHWAVIVGFAAAFLALDRLKPWPIHLTEAIPSGWGVMLDDIAASVPLAIVIIAIRVLRGRLHA